MSSLAAIKYGMVAQSGRLELSRVEAGMSPVGHRDANVPSLPPEGAQLCAIRLYNI